MPSYQLTEGYGKNAQNIFRALYAGDSPSKIIRALQRPGVKLTYHDIWQMREMPELSDFREYAIKKEREMRINAAVSILRISMSK